MSFAATLDSLLDGHDLDEAMATALMDQVLRAEMAPERLAALLVALRAKGPCVDELVGFAKAMRRHGHRIETLYPTLDNCGTGGAAVKTFNISTCASFVLAAAGITVAKHGNRSVTRPSGSADVLERSGADLSLTPAACKALLDDVGIAFLFAPTFHPAMRHAGPVRRSLGVKTIFNLLGPLTNPAGAEVQVLGVYDPALVPLMAEALVRLGCRQGYVLHGYPGTDEGTPCGPILTVPIRDGQALPEVIIDPQSLGISQCGPEDLAPVSAEDAAKLLKRILAGETGPRADAVALNAAFGLVAAGKARNLKTGVQMAREILASGSGMAKWGAFIEATRSHG